ncbi:3-deoxy-D-manno-octulosonic acid transferase [Moraxella nasibovis]|uniref:3-deoxy-D-manno-octulosonic acid transferase n=1 Tax=Moraxella nasibovis TaxID=2904120 RepID=UPI00240ECBB0|nr:3-deoxy-D-manno-octulosonic acid transferase [Moraxella nasibovis]WFF38198.1 3-deoxy-D-manno-octulosonic acid transferase [Moraxella nasibovis]
MKPPFYYPIAIRLAMPIYRYMVHKKSHHLPSYEREINERFGKQYLPIPAAQNPTANPVQNPVDNLEISEQDLACHRGLIWCHAVSLGELNTAYPLLKILLNKGFDLWITSTTQTGFNRVPALFEKELGSRVNHSFVPVDNLPIIQAFLTHIRPVMAIFIETELWASCLYELHRQHIPSVMVNARLTQKSYDGYAKFGKLSQSMMANLSAIIAQDRRSAERFISLGADESKLCVVDSLKWASVSQSSPKTQALLAQIHTWQLGDRAVWLAASTHEGEERLMLDAHRQLLQSGKNPLLILVPRHPERFERVAELCQQMGFVMHRRSDGEQICPDTQVYLADSMGELLAWYAVCDVAVVAGSFVDVGGHNPIEPAMLAKPVVMGRFVKNCELLVDELSAVGALVQADGVANDVACAVGNWLFDGMLARQAGERGAGLVAQKQHAAQAQADVLMECLNVNSTCLA